MKERRGKPKTSLFCRKLRRSSGVNRGRARSIRVTFLHMIMAILDRAYTTGQYCTAQHCTVTTWGKGKQYRGVGTKENATQLFTVLEMWYTVFSPDPRIEIWQHVTKGRQVRVWYRKIESHEVASVSRQTPHCQVWAELKLPQSDTVIASQRVLCERRRRRLSGCSIFVSART